MPRALFIAIKEKSFSQAPTTGNWQLTTAPWCDTISALQRWKY
jgi:hypothetical protein